MEIDILRPQGSTPRDIAVETAMAVNPVWKYLWERGQSAGKGRLAPFGPYPQGRVGAAKPI
ncbi:hypothetical protein [Paraburkholderia sp. JHI869]|uniref:hypothetical protein n=1 Tax=Paraburkholderia sp. JHI869 TaxID=3112959 RepID=UPI003175636A